MHNNAWLKEHDNSLFLIFEYFLDKVQVYTQFGTNSASSDVPDDSEW